MPRERRVIGHRRMPYRVAATVHVAGNGGPRPVAITENISRGDLGVLVYEPIAPAPT